MDAAASLLMGALEKAKEALDECKDAVELAIDVQGVFNFIETVVIMIPKRGQSLAEDQKEDDPSLRAKVGVLVKDLVMQSNSENEEAMKKKRSQSVNLRAKVEEMWKDPRTKSLDITFLGLNTCVTLATETLEACAETLGKIDPNVSCLWFFMPWKMMNQLKAKKDLEKNAMEVQRLGNLIQTAIGVASYGIQLEAMESMFDATALIKNLSLKKFWQENIGRDKTSVSLTDLQESFLNFIFSNAKSAELQTLKASYRALQKGDKLDPLLYATRRLQDLWDSGNRDSNVTIFELSRTLEDNKVGEMDDFMVSTISRILGDYHDFINSLEVKVVSLRPNKQNQKKDSGASDLVFTLIHNAHEFEEYFKSVGSKGPKDKEQFNGFVCQSCNSRELPGYAAQQTVTEKPATKGAQPTTSTRVVCRCESCYEGDVVVRPREPFKVIATWKRPKEWVEYESDRFVVMQAQRDREIQHSLALGNDVEHPTPEDEDFTVELPSRSIEVELRHSSSKKNLKPAVDALSATSILSSMVGASLNNLASPVAGGAASPPPHPMAASPSSMALTISPPGSPSAGSSSGAHHGNSYSYKLEFQPTIKLPGLYDVKMCLDSRTESTKGSHSQHSYIRPNKTPKILVQDNPSISFATSDYEWNDVSERCVYPNVDPTCVHKKVLVNPEEGQDIPVVFYLDKSHTQFVRRISLFYEGPKKDAKKDGGKDNKDNDSNSTWPAEVQTFLVESRWQDDAADTKKDGEGGKKDEEGGADGSKANKKSAKRSQVDKEKAELAAKNKSAERNDEPVCEIEKDILDVRDGGQDKADFSCCFTLPDLSEYCGIDMDQEGEYVFKIRMIVPEANRRVSKGIEKTIKDLELVVKISKDLPSKMECSVPAIEKYFSFSDNDTVIEHHMDGADEFRTVLADRRITPSIVDFYYFEVEILDSGYENNFHDFQKNIIAIGLATDDIDCASELPGWGSHSFAYHGDDGQIFDGPRSYSMVSGVTFEQGDVIGCAWDIKGRKIFFTKKGKGESKSKIIISEHNLAHVLTNVAPISMYPAVGFGSKGAKVKMHFEAADRYRNVEDFLSAFKRSESTYRKLEECFQRSHSYSWRFGLSNLVDGSSSLLDGDEHESDDTVLNIVAEMDHSSCDLTNMNKAHLKWIGYTDFGDHAEITADFCLSTGIFSNGEISFEDMCEGGLKIKFETVYDRQIDACVSTIQLVNPDGSNAREGMLCLSAFVDDDHDGFEDDSDAEDDDNDYHYNDYESGEDDEEEGEEDGEDGEHNESAVASQVEEKEEDKEEEDNDEKDDDEDENEQEEDEKEQSSAVAVEQVSVEVSSEAAAVSAAASASVTMEGYLVKLGGIFKTSPQKRWFVLQGSTLSYYKQKGDATAAGELQLGACSITPDAGLNFTITVPGSSREPYSMIADSADIKAEWVKKITEAIALGAAQA